MGRITSRRYKVILEVLFLINFKIFKYIKEAYRNDLKKNYWSNVLEAFLTLSPIHLYSMNYVTNPTYRVGIGAFNDVLVSMIAGEEGLLKTIKRKFVGGKKEKAPSYAPLTPEYKMAA